MRLSRENGNVGIHWIHSQIENYLIKVSIEPYQDTVVPASFDKTADQDSTLSSTKTLYHEIEIGWQQKIFNKQELELYSKSENTLQKAERKYCGNILKSESTGNESNFIFTYVDVDCVDSNEEHNPPKANIQQITNRIGGLNLFQSNDNQIYENFCRSYIDRNETKWIYMDIMMDSSKVSDLAKQTKETTLARLKWNPESKCLISQPDFNDINFKPYHLEVNDNKYRYGIELLPSKNGNDSAKKEQLNKIIDKLHSRLSKRLEYEINFILPPVDRCRHFVSFVLKTAKLVHTNNIHLEYYFDLPEGVSCIFGQLGGRTHAVRVDKNGVHNFSHVIEFTLESCSKAEESRFARFFVEAISKDSWNRLRSEGYAFFDIDLDQVGYRSVTSACTRPVQSKSERYFIGGAHLLSDITSVAKPLSIESSKMIKLGHGSVSTGEITANIELVKQSRARIAINDDGDLARNENFSSKSLFRSVNSVLREYKRARSSLRKCKQIYDPGEGTSAAAQD